MIVQLLLARYMDNGDRCSEHSNSYQDDTLFFKTPTSDFLDGGHLDRENDIFVRQVLDKNWLMSINIIHCNGG